MDTSESSLFIVCRTDGWPSEFEMSGRRKGKEGGRREERGNENNLTI